MMRGGRKSGAYSISQSSGRADSSSAINWQERMRTALAMLAYIFPPPEDLASVRGMRFSIKCNATGLSSFAEILSLEAAAKARTKLKRRSTTGSCLNCVNAGRSATRSCSARTDSSCPPKASSCPMHFLCEAAERCAASKISANEEVLPILYNNNLESPRGDWSHRSNAWAGTKFFLVRVQVRATFCSVPATPSHLPSGSINLHPGVRNKNPKYILVIIWHFRYIFQDLVRARPKSIKAIKTSHYFKKSPK
jgi:hypothetical protein